MSQSDRLPAEGHIPHPAHALPLDHEFEMPHPGLPGVRDVLIEVLAPSSQTPSATLTLAVRAGPATQARCPVVLRWDQADEDWFVTWPSAPGQSRSLSYARHRPGDGPKDWRLLELALGELDLASPTDVPEAEHQWAVVFPPDAVRADWAADDAMRWEALWCALHATPNTMHRATAFVSREVLQAASEHVHEEIAEPTTDAPAQPFNPRLLALLLVAAAGMLVLSPSFTGPPGPDWDVTEDLVDPDEPSGHLGSTPSLPMRERKRFVRLAPRTSSFKLTNQTVCWFDGESWHELLWFDGEPIEQGLLEIKLGPEDLGLSLGATDAAIRAVPLSIVPSADLERLGCESQTHRVPPRTTP